MSMRTVNASSISTLVETLVEDDMMIKAAYTAILRVLTIIANAFPTLLIPILGKEMDFILENEERYDLLAILVKATTCISKSDDDIEFKLSKDHAVALCYLIQKGSSNSLVLPESSKKIPMNALAAAFLLAWCPGAEQMALEEDMTLELELEASFLG